MVSCKLGMEVAAVVLVNLKMKNEKYLQLLSIQY